MSELEMLDQVAKSLGQRQAEHIAAYEKLVISMADGKPPKIEQIEATLRDAGKNVEELKAAVACLLERRKLVAQLAEKPRLESQQREIEKSIDRENKKLETAQSAYDAVVEPLIFDLRDIKQKLMELANTVSQRLRETCPSHRLVAHNQAIETHARLQRDITQTKQNLVKINLQLETLAKLEPDNGRVTLSNVQANRRHEVGAFFRADRNGNRVMTTEEIAQQTANLKEAAANNKAKLKDLEKQFTAAEAALKATQAAILQP